MGDDGTFGATEVAADGIAAGLIARAAAIGVQLSARAAAIGGRMAVGAAFGAVSGLGGDAIGQVARVEGFGDGGYSLSELGTATAFGAGGGALLEGASGVLGKLGRIRGGRAPEIAPPPAERIPTLGEPGRSPKVRQVPDDQAVRDTFDDLAEGGTPIDRPRYPGKVVRLPDGTELSLREGSKSGGATIDAKLPNGDTWKIHRK